MLARFISMHYKKEHFGTTGALLLHSVKQMDLKISVQIIAPFKSSTWSCLDCVGNCKKKWPFFFAIPIKIKHSNKSSDCYNKTSVVYFSTLELKRFTLSFFPFVQASNSLGSTTAQHTAVKTGHFIEESKPFSPAQASTGRIILCLCGRPESCDPSADDTSLLEDPTRYNMTSAADAQSGNEFICKVCGACVGCAEHRRAIKLPCIATTDSLAPMQMRLRKS